MKKSGVISEQIWSVCFDNIVRFVAGKEREEEKNENVKTVFNIFSKHGVELLVDLGKEILHNQICPQTVKSVQLSLLRSGFSAGGYHRSLEDYVKELNFILDRPEVRNHFQRVFGSENLEPSKRMLNIFVDCWRWIGDICALGGKTVAAVSSGHPNK